MLTDDTATQRFGDDDFAATQRFDNDESDEEDAPQLIRRRDGGDAGVTMLPSDDGGILAIGRTASDTVPTLLLVDESLGAAQPPKVSARHAELHLLDGSFVLHVLSSAAFTFVNEAHFIKPASGVAPVVPVFHDDVLRFGGGVKASQRYDEFVFRLHAPSHPRERERVESEQAQSERAESEHAGSERVESERAGSGLTGCSDGLERSSEDTSLVNGAAAATIAEPAALGALPSASTLEELERAKEYGADASAIVGPSLGKRAAAEPQEVHASDKRRRASAPEDVDATAEGGGARELTCAALGSVAVRAAVPLTAHAAAATQATVPAHTTAADGWGAGRTFQVATLSSARGGVREFKVR